MADRFFIKNFGCKVNAAELLECGERLARAGARVVEIQGSDEIPTGSGGVLIVNSCTVTATADAKVRAFVRRVKRLNPALKIVLSGCMVRAAHFNPSELPFANIASRVADVAKDYELANRTGRVTAAARAPLDSRTRAFVRMQDGCASNCSFCIIPKVRPAESLPRKEVLGRIEAALAAGACEIVLTGTNIGKFADENGRGFVSLVYEAADLAYESSARLRISSIEPEDMRPPVFELFEHPAVCPHLHLPLQSGSPEILRRMRRRYSLSRYIGISAEFRRRFPFASITTDIIVGFPGETEDDFRSTLDVVRDVGFERIHAFRYSPRPGTAAAEYESAPQSVAAARQATLLSYGDKISSSRMQRHLGRTVQVLVEEVSGGAARGYSGEYFRVQFPTENTQNGNLEYALVTGRGESGLLFGEPAANSNSDSCHSFQELQIYSRLAAGDST
ncbi:MAG: MiaB/RimO family radical SAM methylthiotransferase [bacterium]